MIRILYIEDDVMIGKTTFKLLQHEKFEVDWAKNGIEALDFLFRQTYHLVLLDLGLPELDGLDVLKHIRKKMELNKLAVIIISARDQSKEKIQGLKLGADDYIVKPYDFDELVARIESVLRRGNYSSLSEISFKVGQIQLFPNTHRLLKEGQPINVSNKEWAILEPMMMYPNQIFSKNMLEEKLYDCDDEVNSNTIEVHIHNLRQKLGKDFIRNVRGLGYCVESTDK
ncbi:MULTISPECIES: response regulator transcription factor [Acinetobacter]|uniref:DNA-binding response regulator PmrA n=3 Tax=Acinetobacter soli TaxID=487316 RepID=A0A1P8EHQ6_9GAMM|nr:MULTISPECIES: response regulator transcription factor [Acinetobacter]MCL9676341.1 response regulator transcription factor [Acinetobacter sp. ACZLY 512]APV35750.1 DNA-binding response regulator PmrA [Acinetobacter soli]KOR16176.1 transcriptional regulator [Acinetobacter sp. C15]KQD04261.1 two-component system response regulator [Acinetobacter soli]MBO3639592.1 response regulator transcription factor [Acinetobacter soli]